jgi:predicted secreted protein
MVRRETGIPRFELRERKLTMQPAGSGGWVQIARWFFVVVLAVACQTPAAFAATTVVTDADKDGTVQVNAGDTLEVRLKSNPATGSAWAVHPKSSVLFHLISETQAQPADPEPNPDRPMLQVFRFEVKRKGDGILLMRYAHGKQKPFLGEEQFTLHVVIN